MCASAYSRRHYRQIAEILGVWQAWNVGDEDSRFDFQHLIDSFVECFEADNPNFRRHQFLAAIDNAAERERDSHQTPPPEGIPEGEWF